MSLEAVTTPNADGTLGVPEGWRQGRGAYGGLVIGALVRAIERDSPPERRVRSVTAELLAPLPEGTHAIEREELRRGNHVTIARAQIRAYAHAVAVLAEARGSTSWQDLRAPDAPAHTQLRQLPTAAGFPQFTQHFDYWIARGLPGDGGKELVAWLRPKNPGDARDAAFIAAMIDAIYPVVLTRTGPRAVATLAYTLDIVGGLHGLNPDAPLLYRGTAPVCADGYCLETRELWGEDGRLIAVNQQTFVIFD